MTDEVAVVGCGIAGASVALHLAEAGVPTTVYERGRLADETTARSAAFFGFYGSDVERRMKRYAMRRYNDFLADSRAAPTYDLAGRLRVATTVEAARELEEWVTAERTRSSEAIQFVPGDRLTESLVIPDVDASAVEGASYRPGVGYFDARELALEFVERARTAGVTVRTGVEVEEIHVEDGCVRGIVIDGERILARAVVCAAGPWNHAVAATAGLDLPVSHSLAPILKLDARRSAYDVPIVTHEESGVYVRGHRDGSVLVGHYPVDRDPTLIDLGTVDDRVPPELREEMLRVVGDVFPTLSETAVVDEWVGVRSHTPDGHPIVGWTSVEGFSVVAFDSSGVQLSPAAGDVVARQLAHGEPTRHRDDLSIARFDGYVEAPTPL